jgi:hypothetical protein
MDNPQKLATLGAQDTRRYWAQNTLQRQTTKHKPQHSKVKIWATRIPPINPGNPGTQVPVKASSSCFFLDACNVTQIVKTCWSPICVNKLENTS